MRIDVTQEEIDNSRADFANNPIGSRADRCPVALALRRATGVKWYVTTRYLSTDPNLVTDPCFMGGTHAAPTAVGDFVRAFDNKGLAAPFSFELPIGGYIGNPQREGTAPEEQPMQWPTPAEPQPETVVVPEAEPEKVGV